MNKRLLDEKGISLIELLATVLIASLLSIMVFSILGVAMKTSDRVKAEAELRDEADIIMAQLLESVFLIKESEIEGLKNQGSSSYILLKNNQKIGFENSKALFRSKLGGESVEESVQEEIQPLNTKIHVLESSSVNEREAGQYEIKLFLKHDDLKEPVQMQSRIGIIKDATEGKEDD